MSIQSDYVTISELVKKYRADRGGKRPLSYRKFAAEIGVSHGAVHAWEHGLRTPELSTVKEMLDLDGWRGEFAHALYDLLVAV